jgi:hypothetical protein
MSGPRVTSGSESRQDYATPDDLLKSIVKRFGPISFDLAAHAGNKKHPRYFAPTHFYETLEEKLPLEQQSIVRYGVVVGAPEGPEGVSIKFVKKDKKGLYLYEKKTRNDDPEAYGKDAFAHSWAGLSRKYGSEHPSGRAHLWLNCEFSDITPWAARCMAESREGANVTLLTPMTTANWFRDYIAGEADAYPLSGRLSFDGKNVFPKDCLISRYDESSGGDMFLWDWQKDVIVKSWICKPVRS